MSWWILRIFLIHRHYPLKTYKKPYSRYVHILGKLPKLIRKQQHWRLVEIHRRAAITLSLALPEQAKHKKIESCANNSCFMWFLQVFCLLYFIACQIEAISSPLAKGATRLYETTKYVLFCYFYSQ